MVRIEIGSSVITLTRVGLSVVERQERGEDYLVLVNGTRLVSPSLLPAAMRYLVRREGA